MQKIFLLLTLVCILMQPAFGQTQSPVYLSQTISNTNSNGFYRYLPSGYASNTKNYPLIIWVHGAGQIGQGNVTDLPKVLEWGVPKIINDGGFPASFTVGDSSFSFIIISPQFISWPSGGNVSAMLSYVMSNYRVDPSRVYLMGISAGGGAVWEYAGTSVANSDKIAAMIPFCGAFSPTQTLANRIAASNLPVWAFHNTNDGTVPVAYSRNWKNYINSYIPAPNPLAQLTEFATVSSDPVIAHECWSLATLPSYKPNGINIYEWLLGFKKRISTINKSPFANCGQDTAIILPSNFSMNATQSSDPDGIIVSYKWKKISGPSAYLFSDSTASVTAVSNLSAGLYQFELSVTDNMGAVGKDSLNLNVYAAIAPGTKQRILIDAGNSATNGGTITNSPNINGNVWNNMTDARAGIRVSNALTTGNLPSGLNLEVINRIDGTYNISSTGMGNGNTVGTINDYPASATTDHALIQSSATNGRWRITGMQPDKTYTVKFWGARSNTTAARNAEIKRADETLWKGYSATNNTDYNNAAVFIITGKTQMDFDIRTKAGSDFSALNVVDILYGLPDSSILPPPVNLAPVARAGVDTSLQLPVDSVTLKGCISYDPEASPLKYKWRKISGPVSYQMPVDTLCAVKVKGMIAGTYSFELAVTDTAGLTGKDTVLITLVSLINTNWPPQVIPLCNNPYKIVVVGSSTAYGTGANPIDSSWVNKIRLYLLQQNIQTSVINIATPGLTSYEVSPTGITIPAGLPYTVDTLRNITKALSLNPDAIILNLPSNDVARGVPIDTIKNNFNRIVAAADYQHVPIWVTTTQPRNGLSASEELLQMDLRDWINTRFGNKAVDFWNTVANADGTINELYSAGDGVHLNNYGHHILFTRVIEEKLWDTICLRRNLPPVARAGNDTSLIGVPASLTLNGTASFDPEGTILTYNWRILNNAAGALSSSNTSRPVFSASVQGNFAIELKVTDASGSSAVDTISINVSVIISNIPPVANAGADKTITLPTNTSNLDASASYDSDGNIAVYKWRKINNGNAVTITDSSAIQTAVSFTTAGQYNFELSVTDNSGAIAKDTVGITVNSIPNNPPVANAGPDQSIQLPANRILLNGKNSYDPEASALAYKWLLINGPAGSQILTDNMDTSSVTFISAGAYTFRLTVTDNLGVSATDDVIINILAIAGANKKIKVNIYGGTNPFVNPQWNNWNVSSALSSINFLYDDGSISTINSVLSASGLVVDNGTNYALGATVCPPQVLRYNSANTSFRTLIFNGLNKLKKYNFEFYASRNNTGNSSVYQVGTKLDTISTSSNANDFAYFQNISPDVNGKVTVTISRIGTWNYVAGFMLTEMPETPALLANKSDNQADLINTQPAIIPKQVLKEDVLIVYPNPATDILYYKFTSKKPGMYSIVLVDVNGRVVKKKTTLINSETYNGSINIKDLPKGIYLLQLFNDKQKIILKQVKF